MTFEIQETSQLQSSGIKTTFVVSNEKPDCADEFSKSKWEKTRSPENESCDRPSPSPMGTRHSPEYRSRLLSASEPTESPGESTQVSPTPARDHAALTAARVLSAHPSRPQGEELHKSIRSHQLWDIPLPQEFANFNTLEEVTRCLASCRIVALRPADRKQTDLHPTAHMRIRHTAPPWPLLLEAEGTDAAPSSFQFSDSSPLEPVLMRPSRPTGRSSFTKDFINCQKRNNSIATMEHRARSTPKRRHQTYPGSYQGHGLRVRPASAHGEAPGHGRGLCYRNRAFEFFPKPPRIQTSFTIPKLL